MNKLLQIEGKGKGSLFDVKDGVRIGRSEKCEISLSESDVSRIHASFSEEDDVLTIQDEDSRNGVFVNDEQIQETTLSDGDEIKIGSARFALNADYQIQVNRGGKSVIIFDADQENRSVRVRSTQPEEESEGILSDHDRLKTLFRITKTLTSSPLKNGDFLEDFLKETVQGLHAERGAILLGKEGGEGLEIRSVWTEEDKDRNMSISRTVVQEVMEETNSVLCPDATADPRFEGSKSLRVEMVQSFMAAPLLREGEPFGMIYLDTLDVMRSFQETDLDLLENVVSQAGMALANVREFRKKEKEVKRLRRKISEDLTIVGESEEMTDVLETVKKVAPATSTVLLTGETGTGKELISRAIHHFSSRSDGPFVPVDCSTISEQLLESELFGHVEGAFTGAEETRPGKFEAADGGTLFLDEVGNLDLKTQKKLLRFIETRSFTRVGEVKVREVDVRIVTATNRDLKELVDEGSFREDLYYRLAVVPIDLPPLRERDGDIPSLTEHFLEKFAERTDRDPPEIDEDVMELFKNHPWPGNVRQLKNVVERCVVLSEGGTISISDLPDKFLEDAAGADSASDEDISLSDDTSLQESVQQVEEKKIKEALRNSNGKKVAAADQLDISRPTLDKKIEEYDIDVDQY